MLRGMRRRGGGSYMDGTNTCDGKGARGLLNGVDTCVGERGGGGSDMDDAETRGGEVGQSTDGEDTCGEEA
jgi:hypothetical protein